MGLARRFAGGSFDIRVNEDGGRVPPNPISGCGAYWAGRVLCGYGLQPGADREPVVVPGAPRPFSPCDLPGAHCAQNGLTGSPRPCESSPEPSAEAQNPLQSRLHRPLNQLRRTGKSPILQQPAKVARHLAEIVHQIHGSFIWRAHPHAFSVVGSGIRPQRGGIHLLWGYAGN